jgi:hypothetical protein
MPLKNILSEISRSSLDNGRRESLQNTFREILLKDLKSLETKANSSTLTSEIKQSYATINDMKRQLTE